MKRDDDLYDDPPLTLRQLLHALTEDYALLDEPVHVEVKDDHGGYLDCLVTGLSVQQWRGPDGKGQLRDVQSLEFVRNRDGR